MRAVSAACGPTPIADVEADALLSRDRSDAAVARAGGAARGACRPARRRPRQRGLPAPADSAPAPARGAQAEALRELAA